MPANDRRSRKGLGDDAEQARKAAGLKKALAD